MSKTRSKNLKNLMKTCKNTFIETKSQSKNESSILSSLSFIREVCDKCDSIVKLTIDNTYICSNKKCGMLYKENIDQGAEWRFYGANDTKGSDPTRCGMPINPLLKDSSYGCKIDCSKNSSYEMRCVKKSMQWTSMTHKERTLNNEFDKIKRMAEKNGITKLLIDDALRYHTKISEQKTFRGENRDAIIAASIYISCLVNNYPRTAKEIASMFLLDQSATTKGCKNAVMIINQFEKNVDIDKKIKLCVVKPISFIERYCSKLNMNLELTNLCKFLAISIDKKKLMPENTPHSVAGAIIYFISFTCNANISKRNIKDISQISEVTINKCFKKLQLIKDKLLPKSIISKYNSV